ncbi:nucleoside triphosphate pyrophosphohydrolase [Thermomonas sp. HDW16]|uniref:nucleoside triphosphate pyrophosphohydrolase n=1 Tax=Thermomonas sp. HDW16 TaxID=2714945 RepID=UPI0014089068|nr:nucleoside triphosphate pyrophosphohydrolase [Thermomonas sp. HDW16]QIL21354.1 nucleoside triphosphate pyrophosphohydrolase [Thermomonas sp. HDW16]
MSGPRDITALLDIMSALRDPKTGCPWDVEQTFASIAPYTIEEAYEVADAIDRGEMGDLKDELGDLLLQVVFHAQMAQEQGAFEFGDVVAAICDKMTRRHPHVFGDEARKSDAAAQLQHWEDLKRAERAVRGESDTSALAGISRGLPEWQRAVKLQHKAAKVGFDWPDPAPVLEKLHEEIEEVRAEFAAVALSPDDAAAHDRLEDEIGDILFVCANLARHAKVDFGAALRRANHKFERRFRAMEALSEADGGLAGQSLEAQDRYWNRAKAAEKGQPE